MAVTGLGSRFARRIKSGVITIFDVPVRYQQDTRDSYAELFGDVLEE